MQDKHAQLQPDRFYHIYNRANGSELMFLSDENYRFFLQQFNKYIEPIAEMHCYCLMPNHFHFLIKIRPENELNRLNLQGFGNLEGFLSQQFSNLFNSYSKAFNKQHQRKGSLFMHPYKRKQITSNSYLTNLIHYIHFNPIEAGLTKTCETWKFSSYNAMISNQTTLVRKLEVIALFDDINNFKFIHKKQPEYDLLE